MLGRVDGLPTAVGQRGCLPYRWFLIPAAGIAVPFRVRLVHRNQPARLVEEATGRGKQWGTWRPLGKTTRQYAPSELEPDSPVR